jgi:hypothetical protein
MVDQVSMERGGRLAELTILDWIGLVVVVPAVVFLLAAPLVVTPGFAEMFASFGSDSSLPAITRLVMSWWLPPVLAVVPVALVLAAITGRRSLGTRRLLGVVAFLCGAAGAALYLVGMYAPVYAIAGAVR